MNPLTFERTIAIEMREEDFVKLDFRNAIDIHLCPGCNKIIPDTLKYCWNCHLDAIWKHIENAEV